MNLTQAQKALFFRIAEHPKAVTHFDVLCAEFEAALDEVEDPEKTDPFGVPAIRSEAAQPPVELAEAAAVIAVAWLEMIATAITDQEGVIEPGLFDEDGVASFSDTRPLFDLAKSCGFGEGHARRAFARVRKDTPTVRRRAMRILGSVGAIRVPKRKTRLRDANRIHRLAPCFAAGLDSDEVARAKAGSIFYSLVAKRSGYEAVRARKVAINGGLPCGEDDPDIISESDEDVISDFMSPFIPCEEIQETAVQHFAAFLAEKGYTYQRLVYRASAA